VTDVNHHPSGACPEPEQLAAYVDGRVTAEERASIQRHLADCEDCREVVADAVRLRDESASRVLPFWRRRKAQAIGGGILALAASLILVVQLRPELNPFRQPTPLEELVTAVGNNRTVEARLSSAFAYGPLKSPTRGESHSSVAVAAALSRLEDTARSQPTSENLHAVGVGYIISGRHDLGVRQIEAAIAGDTENSRFHNDLAAALLSRGRATGADDDFQRAVTEAKRALDISPGLKEAQFNLALAYEYLNRQTDAEREWRLYLAQGDDAWSAEARARLRP